MNPSIEILENKLAELEQTSGISEIDIYSAFRALRIDANGEAPCPEWQYETLAFSFIENTTSKRDGWGEYFGPMATFQTEKGETVEVPSIREIDEHIFDYWEKRAGETNNPILKARYAGLIWDLCKPATGKTPHYSFAVSYCEAILSIAEKRLYDHPVDVVYKLRYTLNLAALLNKQPLIQRSKNTILEFEARVGEDSLPGLWGFSFDFLIGNKRVDLSEAEENHIIQDLEQRLSRLKEGDPWTCEYAAERLARYYRKCGKEEDAIRVISVMGQTFEKAAGEAVPMVAASMLEHILPVYGQFNLKVHAERVARSIRELGPKIRDGMKELSHTIEIPREEVERFLEQMTAGTKEEVLTRIAAQYLPRREKIAAELQKLAQSTPLLFHLQRRITDSQGRFVAVVGPLEDDLDGNLAHQMCQNMAFMGTFLSAVLERTISRCGITEANLTDYIFLAPVFRDSQKALVSQGIQAYLQNDFVVAIHLLIPQIEAAARNLVEMSGGAILKSRTGGGFHLQTLDEILRSKELSSALGDDTAFYLRVTLTDQRGWNLRNDVCHGLLSYDQFAKGAADRLIHILLLLALLREQETES